MSKVFEDPLRKNNGNNVFTDPLGSVKKTQSQPFLTPQQHNASVNYFKGILNKTQKPLNDAGEPIYVAPTTKTPAIQQGNPDDYISSHDNGNKPITFTPEESNNSVNYFENILKNPYAVKPTTTAPVNPINTQQMKNSEDYFINQLKNPQSIKPITANNNAIIKAPSVEQPDVNTQIDNSNMPEAAKVGLKVLTAPFYAIDWANNKNKFLGRLLDTARSAVTGGAVKPTEQKSTGNAVADFAADLLGNIGGFSQPMAGNVASMGNAMSDVIGNPVKNKVVSALGEKAGTIGGRYATQAVKSAAEMGTLSGLQTAASGGNSKDVSKAVLQGGLQGAIWGVIGQGLTDAKPIFTEKIPHAVLKKMGYDEIVPNSGVWVKYVEPSKAGNELAISGQPGIASKFVEYSNYVDQNGNKIPKWKIQLNDAMLNAKNKNEIYDAIQQYTRGLNIKALPEGDGETYAAQYEPPVSNTEPQTAIKTQSNVNTPIKENVAQKPSIASTIGNKNVADLLKYGKVKILNQDNNNTTFQDEKGNTQKLTNQAFNTLAVNNSQNSPTGSIMNESNKGGVITPSEIKSTPASQNNAIENKDTLNQAHASTQSMNVNDIKADPQRFQFKSDTDTTTGAGKLLKNVGKWDDNLAGRITVWQDKEGNNWVVNGHHRLELAKRLGVKNIDTKVLYEKDGVSAKDAREIGAKINLAEGRGTATDAAKVFRDGNYTTQDLKDSGLSLSEGVVKKGYNIAQLNDRLFNKVVNTELTEDQGNMIGEAFPKDGGKNDSLQNTLYDYVKTEGDVTKADLQQAINMLKNSDSQEIKQITSQTSLFDNGNAVSFGDNFKAKKDIIKNVTRRLAMEKNLFKNLSNSKKADMASKAGNVLNSESNEKNKQLSEMAIEFINKDAWKKGTVIGDVFNKYASNVLAGGETVKNSAEAYKEIRQLIENGDFMKDSKEPENKQIEGQQSLLGEIKGNEKQRQAEVSGSVNQGGKSIEAGEATEETEKPGEAAATKEVKEEPKENTEKPTPEQEKEIERIKGRLIKSGNNNTPKFSINEKGLIHIEVKNNSGNNTIRLTVFRDGQTRSGLFGGKDEKSLEIASNETKEIKAESEQGPSKITLDNWLDSVSKDDIDYDMAERSYTWNSMEPDRQAKEEQTEYVNSMKNIYDKFKDIAKNDKQKAFLLDELNKYKQKYLSYQNEILAKNGRTASPMVTGPAKFNNNRNEKAMNSYMKSVNAFLTWNKNFQKGLEKRMLGLRDASEIESEKYNNMIKRVDETISTLKGIEDGTERGYNPSLFRNSLKGYLDRIARNGDIESVKKALQYIRDNQSKHLKTPVFAKNNSIWKYLDESNNPSAETKPQAVSGVYKQYEGASINKNVELDRVQIFFDEKPSDEVRKDLKASGWHYSPKDQDYRRKLTENALYAAKRILDKYYKSSQENIENSNKKSNGTYAYNGSSETAETNGNMGTSGKPLPRKQIIDNLIKELDIPARVGRFRAGKNTTGIYKEHDEVIRTKLAEDIPTLSHEIGHHLDKLYGLTAAVQNNKAYKSEIMALGEEQAELQKLSGERQIKEGIAEFVRKYLTNMDTKAPTFEDFFEKIINKKLLDAMYSFKQQYYDLQNADPVDKILSQISVGQKNEKTLKEKLNTNKMLSEWIDSLRPLEMLTRQGTTKGINDNPFLKAWLFRGWISKAEAALKYEIIDYSNGKPEKLSEGLYSILKPVKKDMNAFRAYIVSRRTLEKEKQGIHTGFDVPAATAVVEMYKNDETFNKAFDDLKKYQDAILRKLVESEIISKDSYEKMKELNDDYVPFYRVLSNDKAGANYMGESFVNLPNPIKRMKGSNASIVDPIESILKNTYYFINLAERNKVGLALIKFSQENEGLGKFIEKVAPNMSVTTFELGEIKKSLEDIGATLTEDQLSTVARVFRPIMRGNSKDNTVAIYKNGKSSLYQLDPDIYRAVLSMDSEALNGFLKFFSYPARLLRAGAVLNFEFGLRNPLRDMFSAAVYSKNNFIPVIDTVKGIFHVIKRDDLYQLWLTGGGGSNSIVSLERDYLGKNLNKVLSEGEPLKLFLNFIKNPLEPLRAFSEVTEEATRVADFAKSVNRYGFTEEGIEKAALESRDLTLDFNKSGYYGKTYNKVDAFFNAALQGQDKLLRTFKNKDTRVKALLKSLLWITLPSMLLWLLYHDDDKIKALPAWRKDLFWNIPTESHVISIPKPFELGILFGSLPERILDFLNEKDNKSITNWAKDFGDNAVPNLLPTAIQPLIEIWANKSFFTGNAIVNDTYKQLPNYKQYSSYTSKLAKEVGQLSHDITGSQGLSPLMIDNTISGYTGGLGKSVVQGIDAITPGKQVKTPASILKQVPGIKGFIAEPYTSSKFVDEYYQNKTDLQAKYKAAANDYKAAHPNLTDKTWNSMVRNNALPTKELRQYHNEITKYNDMDKQLKALRDKENKIINNEDMSAADKQSQINVLNKQKSDMLDKFNQNMKK